MARALIGSGGIGLSDSEVATLRAALAGNRRPRVVLPGTQFGEDARGQVIAVGDPVTHGDEFIKVRVKLGGMSDTLTFGQDELSLPGRGAGTSRAGAAAASSRSAASPRRRAAPVSDFVSESGPSTTPPAQPTMRPPATGAAAEERKFLSGLVSQPRSAVNAPRERIVRRAAATRRSPTPVTITVSSSGHSWTFAASRGGRSLVKVRPVSAGIVSAVAELLSDGAGLPDAAVPTDGAVPSNAALLEAVADVNRVALAEAEERAELLRTELAAVESLLQSHRRPGKVRSDLPAQGLPRTKQGPGKITSAPSPVRLAVDDG